MSLTDQYIWRDGKIVQAKNMKEWGIFVECHERRLLVTEFGTGRVSTVFLTLDHGFHSPTPILFETMIFGGPEEIDLDCRRYATKEQAVRGHAIMVERVKEFLPEANYVTTKYPLGELLPEMAAKKQDIELGWPRYFDL